MSQQECIYGPPVQFDFFSQLPDEIILQILTRLDFKDLFQIAQACRKLNLLALSRYVLSKISLELHWPNASSYKFFKRSSEAGNIEASLKLGIAYLYGKGVDADVDNAFQHLKEVEQQCSHASPFVWLLFRPPWTGGFCSKACVFYKMDTCAQDSTTDPVLAGRLYYCVAKTHSLHEIIDKEKMMAAYKRAELLHCTDATLEMYKIDPSLYKYHPGEQIHRNKQLLIASHHCLMLRLRVCKQLIHVSDPHDPVKQGILQKAIESGIKQSFITVNPPPPQPELDRDGKMRYILVDWLLEVASLKNYTVVALYVAVDLVDRFLAVRTITRRTLQLLGITCMVVAARYLESDVVTIREAAWLTENTYNYEDVVQMMAEVLAVTQGEIRRPSPNDYLDIFTSICKVEANIISFMAYVSETCLVCIKTTRFAPAKFAAAIFYMSTLLAGFRSPWPSILSQTTNLRVSQFRSEVIEVYNCLFCSERVLDHRGSELRAVEVRYRQAIERNGITDIRAQMEAPTLETINHALDSDIKDEQQQVRANALTPTPPLPKFTGLPLCEITNIPSRSSKRT